MSTLVTGANGLVGAWTLHRLLVRGCNAWGLVRQGSDLSRLRALSACGGAGSMPIARLRTADLRDPELLPEAVRDITTVVHCAARAQDWGPRSEFVRDNVEGLVLLLQAAVRAGRLKRFVLISTTSVEGSGRSLLGEESSPARLRLPYSATKRAAEELAARLCGEHGVSLAVLRPSGVYGPLDFKWSYRMLRLIEQGRWPLIDRGRARLTPVYVHNLVDAIERALEPPGLNGTWNVTDGVEITWHDFSALAAAALGRSLRPRNVPYVAGLVAAAAVELFYRAVRPGVEPPITRYRAAAAAHESRYSCRRAQAELGYAPSADIAAHWIETARWYRAGLAEKDV